MIAVLGMYDMPHAAAAYDRLWQAVRAQLGYGPAHLTRDGDLWDHWRADDLLLGQTCGLPYRTRLWDKVQLVGTPDYALPDCPRGYYFSHMIRRRDDRRGLCDLAQNGTLAINDPMSQSGWAAPAALLAEQGLRPRAIQVTGAHIASAHAVATGAADYAAIDAVTYAMWATGSPHVIAPLDAFARTPSSPALPMITAFHRDPAPIARALSHAISDISAQDRRVLRLDSLVQIPPAAYRALPIPPTPDEFCLT